MWTQDSYSDTDRFVVADTADLAGSKVVMETRHACVGLPRIS